MLVEVFLKEIADRTGEDDVCAYEIENRRQRQIRRNPRMALTSFSLVNGLKEREACCNEWRRGVEPGKGEESLGEEAEVPGCPG